jgi:hypothetical protein
MKIRTDFVSNSSSSSFVLWGVDFDVNELAQKLKDAGLLKEDENADEYSDMPLYEFFENAGFDYGESVIGDDAVVLGMRPDEMKDDETLAQFKQRVVEKLKAANIPVGGVEDIKFITGVDSDGDIMFD